jgi:hypothetical protein
MPVRTRSIYDRHAGDQRYAELRQRLVREWSGNAGPAPAPDITEETDPQGRIVHVIVTWDEWADLDAQTRSELIVDALQAVRGDAAVLNLALAMGLTAAESVRLAHG